MKNKRYIFIIGQLSMAAGILLTRFTNGGNFMDFAIGFFIGLAIAANIHFGLSLYKDKQ